MPSLDAHIHYSLKYPPEELIRTMDATDTAFANLVTVPSHSAISSVPDALMAKDMYPGRLFAFASFDVSVLYRYQGRVGAKMRDYAEAMLKCGADGIKIIEGKPEMRKMLPVPDWDDPQWEPFFAWAETERVPILWHVNDPETFWNLDDAPGFAAEMGWLYDDSYINNEEQYRQVLALLKKFPRLNIIFAHFFFMSAQLPRLDAILTEFPNLMIDLTPGIEMYENFSKNPEEARAFFEKYGNRIVYGTDIGASGVLTETEVSFEESVTRAKLVRDFLEIDGTTEVTAEGLFLGSDASFTMQCLGLKGEALDNILRQNFLRFVGRETPAPVNAKAVLKDIRRVKQSLMIMGFIDKTLHKDTSCLDKAQNYFSRRKHK